MDSKVGTKFLDEKGNLTEEARAILKIVTTVSESTMFEETYTRTEEGWKLMRRVMLSRWKHKDGSFDGGYTEFDDKGNVTLTGELVRSESEQSD